MSEDAARRAIVDLEAALLGLLHGQHSSLTLSFNDGNGPNYQSVKQWVEETLDRNEWTMDWVSEEEKKKAIETNRMWTLHWYPETPVGFHSLSASSLEVLIRAALSPQQGSGG